MTHYVAFVEEEEDKAFWVRFPNLPGYTALADSVAVWR